jgi:hypothetical protein
MRNKFTYINLIKLLSVLILITGLVFLWLSLLHLRLNPSMLKKSCYCTNCEYKEGQGNTALQKFANREIITPEKERIETCTRSHIFIRY